MPGQYKVGTLQAPASIGSVGYTGIGFQPTCVIFFTAGSQTSPGFRDGTRWMVGWKSAAGPSAELADGNISNDNAATSACRRIANSGFAIQYNSSGNIIIFRADCTSLDADGFTLDWTHVTDGQSYVNYLAIGGAANTYADTATFAAATGNQSITGVGFRPQAVLLLAHFSGAFYNAAMGWTDGVNQATWDGESESAQAVADTWRLLLSSRCFAISGNGTINRALSIVSLDADGFTVNCITALSIPLTYLCFRGVDVRVGTFLQPTSASTQNVTGIGFQPGAVLLGSVGQTSQSTVQSENKFALGASDGTNHAVAATHDTDGADPTIGVGYHHGGAAVVAITANATAASSTTEALGTVAMAADGFDVTWSAADATQREWTYLALAVAVPELSYAAIGAAPSTWGGSGESSRVFIG